MHAHTPFRVLLASGALLLAGCGSLGLRPATESQRRVMGGCQAIAGATVQFYAVGLSADAGPAMPLLDAPVITDRNGYFSIYGHFKCADPGELTYVTATGGNPGLGSGVTNANLALMAAVGRCDTAAVLNPIQINEVTTVAAVYALAPFMTSAIDVGSAPAHNPSLIYAFSQAAEMARLDNGTSPGAYLPAGDEVPFVVINTLADAVSSCVNSSGGRAGDGSRCGQFFSLTGLTGPAGTTPTTISALLALAGNPTENTVPLFNLAPASARFQPSLNLPPVDFRIGVTHGEPVQVLPSAGILFPNQVNGTMSAASSVTIYNSGTTVASVTGIAIVGADPSDFALGNTAGCSGPLAPGGSCVVQVSFRPILQGRRSAYLAVQTTGTTSYPPALPLSGDAL